MGIFGSRRESDPSDEWNDYVPGPIVFDLPNRSLNDVSLEDQAGEICRIGKPSNKRPFKAEKFDYLDGGFTIEIEGDRVSYFGLAIVKSGVDSIGGCTFTMICSDGSSIDIGPDTTWPQLRDHLPPPASADREDREAVYEITFDGLTLEVECSPEDKVRRINLFPSD